MTVVHNILNGGTGMSKTSISVDVEELAVAA
jgi:hypothetical protein